MEKNTLKLKEIKQEFSICKIVNINQVNFDDEYCFIGKTDEELSLVCSSEMVPEDYIECDCGWKGFRIQGVLDFSLIGILSPIASVLSENKIGIFAVSTYNTDYILVREENFLRAIRALKEKGYEFE